MATQTNTFTLVNYTPLEYRCTVSIQVQEKTSGGNSKYDINYQYTFPEGQIEGQDNPAHPFYQKNVDDITGVMVFKNEMTETMIKYLMMDDSELSKFTGTTTPIQYRKLLINSLDSFWD